MTASPRKQAHVKDNEWNDEVMRRRVVRSSWYLAGGHHGDVKAGALRTKTVTWMNL